MRIPTPATTVISTGVEIQANPDQLALWGICFTGFLAAAELVRWWERSGSCPQTERSRIGRPLGKVRVRVQADRSQDEPASSFLCTLRWMRSLGQGSRGAGVWVVRCDGVYPACDVLWSGASAKEHCAFCAGYRVGCARCDYVALAAGLVASGNPKALTRRKSLRSINAVDHPSRSRR